MISMDDVIYRYVLQNGDQGFAGRTAEIAALNAARHKGIALIRTTIRNGGHSHTDVTVDVLPCNYQEPTP